MNTLLNSTLTTDEIEIQRKIRASSALARLEEIITCGDRFVGAGGDRKVAELVRRTFTDWGLEEREFETIGYEDTRAEIAFDGETYAGIPPYFSPATAPDGVEGDLVYVGGGDEDDYEGLDVEGRIAVMDEPGLGYARFWMGTFAALAARHGAKAVVVVHPLPWSYRMSMEAGNSSLENRFLDEQVPVLSVSGPEGAQLMRAIGSGAASARLVVESEMPHVTSSNISGVLKGSGAPDERVLVVGHRDHGVFPGANDNGSGMTTMLEVASALAGSSPHRSIEFLNTTAEEGVTKGVFEYIEARRREGTLDRIKAVINLDMFGCGGKLKLVEVGLWPDSDPIPHTEWLMRRIETVAESLGYDVGRMTATWGVAESGRFLTAGIPAAWFWKPDDFYYHSPEDTLDKLDGNSLKAVADITAIVVWQLSNTLTFPSA
jgi:aminopeptidase YwaD